MKKIDDLDLIVRMKGPLYRRIRENCCEFHGLGYGELDRHAASITKTVAWAAAKRATVNGCQVGGGGSAQFHPPAGLTEPLQETVVTPKSSGSFRGEQNHEGGWN